MKCTEPSNLFEKAIEAFDRANANDLGTGCRRESLCQGHFIRYAHVGTPIVVSSSCPRDSSVSCHSQHLCRWHIPRTDSPAGHTGYLHWHSALKDFHATGRGDSADSWLRREGIEKVKPLLRKQQVKQDPDTQVLEDVVCLVFLEFYFP